jgi:hypothetical protein
MVRRAAALGWATLMIDGSRLGDQPDGPRAALLPLGESPQALVVIDALDDAPLVAADLREGVLRTLPPGWVVVLVSRSAPDPAWQDGGWEHVVVDLPVGPLPAADAVRCAEVHGAQGRRAAAIAEWAQGNPLAITLGATAERGTSTRSLLGSERAEHLLERLLGDWSEHLRLLGVAAIARTTTPELLKATLGHDPEAQLRWLEELPFASVSGRGVALQAVIADAVRTVIEQRHPELDADLRRAIAHHVHAEALAAGAAVSPDLALLERDPAIRWGLGWDRDGRYRLTGCRPGDAEAIEADLASEARATWWPGTRRCFDEWPAHVWVARHRDGSIGGFMVIASTADTDPPPFDDPVLGPWLDHAHQDASGHAVIWRNATDLTPDGRVQPLLGGGGLLVSGAPNPRYLYLPIDPAHERAVAFSRSLGGRHLPQLDVDHGEGPTECHVVDVGPAGVLGAQLAAVLRETGPSTTTSVPPRSVDPEDVRTALRSWDRPDQLARSPLATGATAAERVASVQTLVRGAAAAAFGMSPSEQALRDVFTSGLLERTTSHEQVAAELHLSRSSYFRLLGTATQRVVDFLAG